MLQQEKSRLINIWKKLDKEEDLIKTCKPFTRETGLSSLRLKETIAEGSEPSFLVRDARVTLEDSSS